jgi:hypothetical protein
MGGDIGVKILIKYLKKFWGVTRHHLNSYAHAEHMHKFLMRMLSARISSLRVRSACFDGICSSLEFLRLC